MANELQQNIVQTRIKLKYDTYSNWTNETTGNPELLAGEVAICEIPGQSYTKWENDKAVTVQAPPHILMKVGPGRFNDLDWTSAKAADVYAWAKQANLPIECVDDATAEGYVKGNVIASVYFEDNKIKYTTATVATSEGLAQLTGIVNGHTTALSNVYTKEEADAAFTDAAEVEDIIDAALAKVSGTDAIDGITSLVNYVNTHGTDLAAITKEIYGGTTIDESGTSRIDTAINDSATAVATANTAKSTADTAKSTADTAKSTADAASQTANQAKEAAIGAANSAKSYSEAAAASAGQAATSASGAATSAGQASQSASSASTSAEAASESAQAAANDASVASSHASTAQGHAQTASQKASAASTSATNAENAKVAAVNAKDAAVAAQGKAEDAESAAEGHAADALASKNAAATSEQNASNSATTASQKAADASTSAQGAANSASAASSSASDAADSAAAASLSESNAATSAGTASTKAGEAAASASTASTKAGEAATSAQNAATAKSGADTAKNAAVAAQGAAETAQSKAEAAQSAAEAARDTAVNSNTSATAIANQAAADAAKAKSDAAQAVTAIPTKLNANGWTNNATNDGWSYEGDSDNTTEIKNCEIKLHYQADEVEITSTYVEVSTDEDRYTSISSGTVLMQEPGTGSLSLNPGYILHADDSDTNRVYLHFPAVEGTVTRTIAVDEDFHAIAKSGSIYDIKEGSNANTGADKTAHPKYLIFDCGSATDVI